MKESVKSPKNPWPPAVCAVAIAGVFFYLLANNSTRPPGPNLLLDVDEIVAADRIETDFEETESIDPGLIKPSALAVAPDGSLYIAGKDEIVVLGTNGGEVARFAVAGAPRCIGIAPDGATFIGFKDHVEVFDANREFVSKWENVGGRALFTSIAADEENVFVADMGNRIVLRYDRNGGLVGRIGKKNLDGDVPGIVAPSAYLDVAFDSAGALWVVNPGRMGLESYRPDGSLITAWYKPSLELEGFSGCCNPSHIAFDTAGRLIAADKGLVRLKVYDVDGGTFEELIAGTKAFPRPRSLKDIAVDARDRIMVLDPRKDVVRVFERKGSNRV